MELHHPDFINWINPEAEISQLCTGFDFVEGPVWDPAAETVIFSDILGNSLYQWHAESGVSQLKRHSYMANGNAYDQHGRLLTCEHATSRLTRTDLQSGDYVVLASHFDGRALNSPNDVVVKSDGAIYFTDPTSGRSAAFGVPREPELPFSGVYRLDPETGTLNLLIDDFAKPNGLCFAPDESLLYVNDTERQHIRVFAVTEEGGVENGRLFADLTGAAPGVADGMKVDSLGTVYSCGPGGIHLFLPDGTCLGVIPIPEFTTNFVFGDADWRTLYITASTSLYNLRVRVPGHPTFKGSQ
jgi:gluconolactonase